MVPDVIFVRGEFAFLTEPLASESTDYAYGIDHALLVGRYSDDRPAMNRAQVFGSSRSLASVSTGLPCSPSTTTCARSTTAT